jgi:hypothetical protein
MANMTRDAARWYLAGMFDGEGSVGKPFAETRAKGKSSYRSVRIGSTDRELTDRVAEALGFLEIPHRYYTNQSTLRSGLSWHTVQIHSREGLLRFSEEVPFTHIRKRAALDAIVAEVRVPRKSGRTPGPTDFDRPCDCRLGHKNLKTCKSAAYNRRTKWRRALRNPPKAADIGNPEEEIVIVPVREPAQVPAEQPI